MFCFLIQNNSTTCSDLPDPTECDFSILYSNSISFQIMYVLSLVKDKLFNCVFSFLMNNFWNSESISMCVYIPFQFSEN